MRASHSSAKNTPWQRYRVFMLLVCVLVLNANRVFPQQKTEIKKMTDSCMAYIRSGRIEEASALCDRLIAIERKLPVCLDKAEIYRVAGNLHTATIEYTKAEKFYTDAIKMCDKLGNDESLKLKAAIIFNHSMMYYNNGDFEMVLKMCFQAEHIFRKFNDAGWLSEIYNRLGGTFGSLNQKDKAIYYNNRTYEEAVKSGDSVLLGPALIALANNYLDLGDTLQAIRKYEESFRVGKKLQIFYIMSTACYDMAFVHSKKDNFQKALQYYRLSYIYEIKARQPFHQCDALYKMGLMHVYLGNYESGKDTLMLALSIAEQLNSMMLERNIYEAFCLMEEKMGNYKKAFEYLNLYYDLDSKVMSEQGQQQVNFLEAKYNAAEREADIYRLTAEKKIKEEQINKRNLIISVIALLLLLTVLISFFIFRSNRQKQRLVQQENEIKTRKIKELEKDRQIVVAHSLLEGETSERSRISRDLHDGLGSMLSSVKLKIANMKGNMTIPDEFVQVFNSALEMIDSSIRELRRVAHNLMPESLMKYGLNAALADFCKNIDTVSFHFYGNERRLDEKLEVNLYRIVNELVNNALKHAEAQQINVQLILETKRVSVIVQDDGKGFDITQVDEGRSKGIKSIRSRVSSIDGCVDLISAPGKGTEVTVEINL